MSFVLRKDMNIGSISAEDDDSFLQRCFVDTPDLYQLQNLASPKCIALGRTGSGKSALLLRLQYIEKNVIKLNPEDLSLNYISNSDIIRFFENLDIDLDVFYQILWRHILAVEIIKTKKQLSDENTSKSWISNLFSRMKDNDKKKRALNYLFEYGTSFWADTEQRVREVVDKIEKSLEDSIGISVAAFKARMAADLKDKNTESIARTTEIIHKAQRVVNGVQIQELNAVMDLLAEDIFQDSQEKYYIVIDDLDTGWVHDKLRFKLIRALIRDDKEVSPRSKFEDYYGIKRRFT